MSAPLPPEDVRLLTRLNQHPQLRGRIERLVDIVEDAGDDLRKADDAERRVIEEVRRLGQEVLGDWADGQVAKRAEELQRTPGVWREGKKTLLAQHLRRHRSQRTTILVDHYQLYPSFALRFDTDDGSLVISSDTGPDTKGNLQRLAKGADVLVHEVIDDAWVEVTYKGVKEGDPTYLLYHHMITAHTMTKNVGKVAERCGVKTLILSHIGPGNTPASRLMAAQNGFSGKLIVGEDLMQVGVGRPRG